ncbi:hypothetical protein [Qipengyuania nanhaisediminis]|uniref:hypothetical protein n=1 Tax=Qipengyuania nanhaisediminis TaxID=604088 RepID=UPI0038B32262
MTKPDDHASDPLARPLLGQVLFYVGFCLGLGAIGAGLAQFSSDGLSTGQWLALAGLALTGLALVVLAIRIGNFDPPGLATNTGRSQLLLLGSCLVGGMIGVYLITTGAIDRFTAGDLTLTRIEALAGLFILIAVAVPASLMREKTADDFERAAAREAAYWALWIYFTLYLGWAVAAMGSLVPPVHDFALFMIVVFVMLGIWMVKRSG